MSSTQTYTEEQFAQAQTILDSKGKGHSLMLPTVFTRVSVLCAKPGCESIMTGHEVVMLKVGYTLDQVGAAIKKKFRDVQDGDVKVRSNVRHCLWTAEDHKIDSIKINWSGANINGWSDNGETFLTTENCKDVLFMMADRHAADSMTVTISNKA